MKRQAMMQREVERGETWDVSRCQRRTADGDYILPHKMHPPKRTEGRDYADVDRMIRVQSIGRNKRTGLVVASLTGRFYGRPGWECVWLR